MADRDYGRLYPVARAVLTPIFKFSWRVYTTGLEHLPCGPGGHLPQPRLRARLVLPAPRPAPAHHLRGQGGVPRRLEDPLPLPRHGDDPHRPQGWIGGPGGARHGRTCSSRASCSAYIEGHEGPRRAAPPGPHGRRPSRSPHRRPDRPRRDGGHRDVQPPDAAMPRPFRPVWVNVGRPIDVSRYGDRSDDRLLLRQLTDEVMYEIRELSGQEYVDEYATKKPEDIPRRRPRP